MKTSIDTASAVLTEELGSIIFKPEGIYPTANPSDSTFDVDSDFRVSYVSERKNITSSLVRDSLVDNGLVYSPFFSFMWVKNEDSIILPMWFGPVSNSAAYFNKLLTLEQFEAFVDEGINGTEPLSFNGAQVLAYNQLVDNGWADYTFVFSDLTGITLNVMTMFSGVGWTFSIFFKTLWYCLLFMGIFFLMNRRVLGNIPFKAFYTMSIYVGFAPILVASLFPALGLPYFDYETVYYIGFLVYLFPVISQVQRSLNTPTTTDA